MCVPPRPRGSAAGGRRHSLSHCSAAQASSRAPRGRGGDGGAHRRRRCRARSRAAMPAAVMPPGVAAAALTAAGSPSRAMSAAAPCTPATASRRPRPGPGPPSAPAAGEGLDDRGEHARACSRRWPWRRRTGPRGRSTTSPAARTARAQARRRIAERAGHEQEDAEAQGRGDVGHDAADARARRQGRLQAGQRHAGGHRDERRGRPSSGPMSARTPRRAGGARRR